MGALGRGARKQGKLGSFSGPNIGRLTKHERFHGRFLCVVGRGAQDHRGEFHKV